MLNVFPILSRTYAAKSAQVRSWVQDTSIKCLMALSLPLAVGITFAAHPILGLLYGEEFVRATPILQWAVWTLPLTCLVEVFWRILAARNEQHTLLQVQIVSTLLRVAVAYGLTVALGAPGAALAAVVSLSVHTALLLNRVRRDGTAIHPYRLAWRFGLGAFAMGIVIVMTMHHVHLWMVAVIAAATYAAFSIFTRAVSGQDLIVVRQMMLATRKP